jgi:hypothetical protein
MQSRVNYHPNKKALRGTRPRLPASKPVIASLEARHREPCPALLQHLNPTLLRQGVAIPSLSSLASSLLFWFLTVRE